MKAGFFFGVQFREGTLYRGGRKIANYRSVAASHGFQAGVQAFGYAMFFMTDAAPGYLDDGGWEIGVGPSIVIVDAGVARNHDEHDPERYLRLHLRPEEADGRNQGREIHPCSVTHTNHG